MGDSLGGCVRDVLVVVPARNEEDLLPACLDSLEAARSALARTDPQVRVTAVVVLGDLRDSSESMLWTTNLAARMIRVGRRVLWLERYGEQSVARHTGSGAAPSRTGCRSRTCLPWPDTVAAVVPAVPAAQ